MPWEKAKTDGHCFFVFLPLIRQDGRTTTADVSTSVGFLAVGAINSASLSPSVRAVIITWRYISFWLCSERRGARELRPTGSSSSTLLFPPLHCVFVSNSRCFFLSFSSSFLAVMTGSLSYSLYISNTVRVAGLFPIDTGRIVGSWAVCFPQTVYPALSISFFKNSKKLATAATRRRNDVKVYELEHLLSSPCWLK